MKSETTENGTLEHWTPEEVAAAFSENDIVLIDVRTPQEFGLERIEGALLAPMQAFQPEHMPDQSKKQIVFHCGSGVRSEKVARQCLAAGFDRIAHMESGFGGWKEAGLKYIGTDVSTGAPKEMQKSN
ncbi:rhodanese-like domain-containing protein [Marivita sp. S6314]|uniref:rhodanese-like domain-containing protein n=1 Tax=Marivita sp. S6314 TaxID=2926406 RepID=UPI001FF65C77|nr:rhodanese-like domain-containing protein [Marivita sp. S6314]MCK0149648.1 rhodanese-like domain-containing protein [Marivita sp. S6314]